MGRGIAAGVAIGAAAGACFTKPDPPSARDDAGTAVDAPDPGGEVDATLVPCMSYTFGSGQECGAFGGFSGSNGSASISNDRLILQLGSNGPGSASCTTSQTWMFSSATLEVTQLAVGASGFTTETHFGVNIGTDLYGVRWSGATKFFGDCAGTPASADMPWSPINHRFVHLSRTADTLYVKAGASAIGPWTTDLGSCSVPANALDDVTVTVGASYGSGDGSSSEFESLDLCP